MPAPRSRPPASRISPRLALGLLAAFSSLTTLYTWPLPARLGSAIINPALAPHGLARADAYLVGWMLSWGAHRIRTAPWRLFDANILHPFPSSLTFSEHLVAGALLVLPVDTLGASPIVNHNVLLLASFVLGGTGTALLVRELGGSLAAALAGGALFAFCPLRVSQLGHVHLLATHWLPFALLALHRSLRTGRPAAACGAWAMLVLAVSGSVYYAYFFGLTAGVFLLLHPLLHCPAAPGARRRTVIAALLALPPLAVLLLPYWHNSARLGLARDPNAAVLFSAVGTHYLGAIVEPLATLRHRYVQGGGDFPLFGIVTITLALASLIRGAARDHGGRRSAWLYALLLLAMALVSFGPLVRLHPSLTGGLPGPWQLLSLALPGLDALRVPYRAAVPAVLAACVLAALGVDAALGRSTGRTRRGVAALLGVAVLAECWPPPLHVHPTPPLAPAPAAYRWLAQQPGDFAIVELPLGTPEQDAWYMVRSTAHWKRLVNGYSGFSPAGPYTRQVLAGFPDAESLRLLAGLEVRYVLVHPALLPARGSSCAAYVTRGAPWLALREEDTDTCVLALLGAPPADPPPRDRPVDLAGATVTASCATNPGAAIDGDLATHWVQAVDAASPGWLELDLGARHVVSRVVIHLGSHFAERLSSLALAASDDGEHWTTLVDQPVAAAPLVDLLRRPDDLRVEIRLPPTTARRLRLVRPARRPGAPWDQYADWLVWGVHELEVTEIATPP